MSQYNQKGENVRNNTITPINPNKRKSDQIWEGVREVLLYMIARGTIARLCQNHKPEENLIQTSHNTTQKVIL